MMNTPHSTRARWRNLLLVLGLLAALAHAQVVNPLNVNLSEDTDQDGISNADEIALGLDPYNPYNSLSALDGAVFVVAWERYLGASSSTIDTDGDGWSDFDEVMVYQTNLFDERSLPGPISNLSAAMTSQPVATLTTAATPSTSLIKNGDFSKTGISTWIDGKKLKGYNGSGFEWAAGSVEGWSAYAGSTIEVWNTGTRVVELNGDKSNYGIQQKVEIAKPGAYLLTWRSLGRTQEAAPAKNKKTPPAPDNFYFVQVQIGEGRSASVIKKENFTAGGDGVFVFQLSEKDLTAANGKGIYIVFIPTNGSNSYGSLISGVNLVPLESAPDVLAVNTNFDERKIKDGFAQPDAEDTSLQAVSGPNAGRIVTTDLHQGFFGLRPGVLPYTETAGAVVKIKKLDKDDPVTGTKQTGHVRMYAVWGDTDSAVLPIELYNPDSLEAYDLGPRLYMTASPNQQIQYYLEGVKPGKITLEFSYQKGSTSFKHEQEFEVFGPLLVADVDRDGMIDPLRDMSALAATQYLRHWVNDDSDAGEAGDASYQDIPGSASAAGMENGRVDGSRDLVDFFPVLVRLPPVRFGEVSSMKLRNVDEAFNVVFTKLGRGNVRDHLTVPGLSDCGLEGGETAASAKTYRVTDAGLDMPLKCFEPETVREVVLLVEASKETESLLELVVGFTDGKESTYSIPVSAHGVEQMFRHVDLTGLAKEYDGGSITPPVAPRGTDVNVPSNMPDSETNGKHFVFVHGYNIDAQEARGWNAEMFKRMYALGSKAKFIGVTWNGTPHTYVPDLISEGYPDYHKAVFHAFLTGDGLAAALSLPAAADVTVAAHSLGNIVVSHAIQSGGFRPSRYYMINAVVPMEALDPSVLVDPDHVPTLSLDLDEQDDRSQMARQMTESDWDGRNPRLFASNWHKLFAGDAGDARRNLKWAGLFEDLGSNPNVYNFYSNGEDVVQNPKSRSSWVVLDMAKNWDKKRGAWGHQEMIKGGAGLGAAVMSRVQGGWSANLAAYSFNHAPSKEQAPDSLLKVDPYFNKFQEVALFSPDAHVASAMAAEPKVRYDLLARGIPSLSYAAAANKIAAFTNERNFDMEADCRVPDAWPAEGHDGLRVNRWIHSDFKNVALPYVYPMYQKMITEGALAAK
jgi:hypothetical protein